MNLLKKFSKISGRFPLKVILIFPFVLQLLTVVAVMGYLSFNSGQKSVNEVATDLRNEITARIEQHLKTYLNIAHFVNQMNANALRLGQLDITKPVAVQRYFWQQLQQLDIVSYISFSSAQGQYIGVERRENRNIEMSKKKADEFYLYTEEAEHLANDKGEQEKLTKIIKNYDPRERPWYKSTISANKPIWSDIYALTDPENLSLAVTQTLSANQPYYDDEGTFQGVLGTDIFLSQIREFLSTLKIGKTGETFIMEHSGLIVASSTTENPYKINPDNPEEVLRLKVYESKKPLIRETAEYLREQFGDLSTITKSEQLSFKLEGEQQLLQVKPYHDERGIDWLIVVIVPESDFMARIHTNTQVTILLFVLTLLIAILVGIFTAKWVIVPIVDLKIAASKLSSGKWEQRLPTERTDEIGALAKAFEWMALQLKELFENLEQKVAERTEQLKRKNELIRQVFGRYLSDEVVDTLLESDEGLSLGGERREITMLTSDIRGFTAQSNTLPPEQVIKIINFYLSAMTEIITKYQGVINEIMGDGILVFFGAPILRDNDPERALACAIEMQLMMDKINKQITDWGFSPLEMGIGINTGDVVVGNIGSEKRTKYSALGNEVNLTYRIESYSIGGQIFVSKSTLDKIGDIVQIRSEMQVKPKGIKQVIAIYEVEGIGGKYNLYLPREKEFFVPLIKEVPLQYTILEGKHVDNRRFGGKLLQLSMNGAVIHCEVDKHLLPSVMKNIKINFFTSQPLSTISDNTSDNAPQSKQKNHRVLIVDDVPTNIDLLRNFLASENYKISFANNGEKALKIIRHSAPDLILLDVMMPGINGFEVCRILKSQAETEDIPVIFMTALNSVEDKVKGFNVGAIDYITKPFREEEVLARIRTHISTYHLHKTLEIEKTALIQQVTSKDGVEKSPQKVEDIYAKVLRKEPQESILYIQFTSIPTDIKSRLISLCQLEWTKDLAVNHLTLDKQHQGLFVKSKQLIDAISDNQKENVFQMLDFFENDIIFHFDTEEKLMREYNYPDDTNHRSDHIRFIKSFKEFKRQYRQNKGANVHLNLKIQWKLIETLICHIKEFDKPLGKFINSKEKDNSLSH